MLKKLLLATTAMFMLFVAPAHAGPLVGGIGALIGGIAGSGLTIGGLALGIFSMGAQWLISMLLAPEVEQKGVKTKMDTGGDNPPSFILGEYCTAGQLIYANVWDKSGYNIENACLVYVIQLSCKPVNALSNAVFANNEKVTINPGTNWNGFWQVNEYVKGASGGGYFLVKFHDGTQNTADDWLIEKFGNDPDRPWKNDMVGKGCAYIVVQAWYSNRGVWTGLPDLRWVVQGSKLYDPRKDSTVGGSGTQRWNDQNTWTFSKNPKVIEFNTIRGIRESGEHLWGGNAEAYRLPLDYWFAAMNACDETITLQAGGTVKRFEIGCEIHLDDKPIDIIAEINKSCNGYTTEFGGTYKTWVGGPGLPVGTVTDDDFLITADMETNRFQSQQSTYNTAYATYPEPRQQWEPKDGPRYRMADAIEEDGEELALDISLPFVSENNQVQRLMRAAVQDSRRQVTHEGQMPPKAWVYEPFDCLAYQSELFGYSGDGKDFIVASKDDLPNVNQRVLLREVDITDTGWLPEYEQPFDTSPLVIVAPGTMQADFTVSASQVNTTTGTDKPAIRAVWAWAGPEIDVRKVDWQIRYSGTTTVIASGSIISPEDGFALIEDNVLRFGMTYEIQLRAIPYAVRETEWTAWKTVTCVVVAVPSPPGLTRISKLGTDGRLSYFVDVSWTPVAMEATYAVTAIIDSQTMIFPATTTPLRIPVAAGAVLTVSVAAVGSDGTIGAYSSTTPITITKKNTAPTAPTALTATGKIGRIDYKTNKNPDNDFDHFNLYASSTNDFTTAVLVDDSRSIQLQEGNLANAVTRYSWITAVDNSGNESSKFPASNTAGRVATTAKVGAADISAGAVDDAALDQTAPGTPTVTVAAAGGDFDDDGALDAGIAVSIVYPNTAGTPTGVKIARYIVTLQRSATLGGTYADFPKNRYAIDAEDTADSLTTVLNLPLNRKYFYKARARAVSAASSKKGAFSGYTTPGVQPSLYTGYNGAAVSAPAVSQLANGYFITGSLGSLNSALFKEMEILVGGVTLIKTKDLTYKDMTSRTVGATPSYTIKLYDKAGSVSATSTATVAPAYRATTSTEIGANQVTTTQIAADAVTSVELAPASVYPTNYYRNPAANLLLDFECLDRTKWTFKEYVNGSAYSTAVDLPPGNALQAANASDSGYGGSDFTFELQHTSTGATKVVALESDKLAPVSETERYKFGAMVNQIGGSSTKWFNTVELSVRWWKTNSAGVLTLISEVLLDYTQYSASITSNIVRLMGYAVAPLGASWASILVTAKTQLPQTAGPALRVGSPSIRSVTRATDLIKTDYDFTSGDTSFGGGAAGVQVIKMYPALAFANTDVKRIADTQVSFTFRHKSGSLKTFNIRVNLVDAANAEIANLYSVSVVEFRDNELVSFTISAGFGITIDPTTAIELRLFGAAAGNIISPVQMSVLYIMDLI